MGTAFNFLGCSRSYFNLLSRYGPWGILNLTFQHVYYSRKMFKKKNTFSLIGLKNLDVVEKCNSGIVIIEAILHQDSILPRLYSVLFTVWDLKNLVFSSSFILLMKVFYLKSDSYFPKKFVLFYSKIALQKWCKIFLLHF